ncbi:hypothetical protein ACH42_14420 [Endozoicomonas sp. (ex Bugula neritina AB1)]|nr:hypothetical protein ACH42_14420 [Endozoicomonas sp. (ex Bugula neritina AB1)]
MKLVSQYLLLFIFSPTLKAETTEVCQPLPSYLKQYEKDTTLHNPWVVSKRMEYDSKWEFIDLNSYCVIRKLGEGGHGLALLISSYKDAGPFGQYVLKIYKQHPNHGLKRHVWPLRDAELYEALKKFRGYTQALRIYALPEQTDKPFMTLFMANDFSLRDLISRFKADQEGKDFHSLTQLVIDILELLTEMHCMGIHHWDLYTGNIMFSHDQTLKFIDFSYASISNPVNSKTFNFLFDIDTTSDNIKQLISASRIPEEQKHLILSQISWMSSYQELPWESHISNIETTIKHLKHLISTQ